MRIVLYMCEEGFKDYINNISGANEIVYCYESYYPDKEHIQIDQLSDLVFEYIIIMSEDIQKSEQVEELLVARGIPYNKILRYCYFRKNPAKSAVELFFEKYINQDYDGFIFGMSHSHGGCIEALLKDNIYKFSAPSMDLYYHYKVLQDVCQHYDMSKINRVIFELPYYVFNYDISMCSNTFIQRMNYYKYYNDYHHFGKTEQQKRYIVEFDKLNKFCTNPIYNNIQNRKVATVGKNKVIERIKKYYRTCRYTVMTKRKHYWTDEEKSCLKVRAHVWYKLHKETIEENVEIWHKIRKLLEGYNNIELSVIVFPFCPWYIDKHETAIAEMKRVFDEKIEISPDKIWDCFKEYMNFPEYFEDDCHLNLLGAYDFSKKINGMIRGRR